VSTTTPVFDLFLGPDGCGQVRLPSNFTPAHLRAVREAIGSDYEIAPIDDDTWSPMGGSEFLTIRKRAASRFQQVHHALVAATITGLVTVGIARAAAAGHWTQAILSVINDIQEYI
jgi:hypothetical protein